MPAESPRGAAGARPSGTSTGSGRTPPRTTGALARHHFPRPLGYSTPCPESSLCAAGPRSWAIRAAAARRRGFRPFRPVLPGSISRLPGTWTIRGDMRRGWPAMMARTSQPGCFAPICRHGSGTPLASSRDWPTTTPTLRREPHLRGCQRRPFRISSAVAGRTTSSSRVMIGTPVADQRSRASSTWGWLAQGLHRQVVEQVQDRGGGLVIDRGHVPDHRGHPRGRRCWS